MGLVAPTESNLHITHPKPVGVIVAPRGRLLMVLRFIITNGKIAQSDAVALPERLRLAIFTD